LAYGKFITNLKILTLSNNKIGNQGFKYLLGSSNFPNLKKLLVNYNEI
jgi:Leucine-rich repeat (LRR) protein